MPTDIPALSAQAAGDGLGHRGCHPERTLAWAVYLDKLRLDGERVHFSFFSLCDIIFFHATFFSQSLFRTEVGFDRPEIERPTVSRQ